MRRTVVGIVLLAVLLAGGFVSSAGLARHNEEVAPQLDAAAVQAMAGDLPGAMEAAEEAQAAWEERWGISAAFTDHNPREQIDGGFARLRIYGEAGDNIAYAAVCMELSKQIEAIGDAHGAQWWNIL